MRRDSKVLTDTDWEVSRPGVVLLTDPYRGPNKSKPRVALVDHCVSVAKVLPDYLPVHNELWNTTVTSCKEVRKDSKQTLSFFLQGSYDQVIR